MAFLSSDDSYEQLMNASGGHGGTTGSAAHAGHGGHGGHGETGASGHAGGHGGMHSMSFHFGCDELILFNFWTISTYAGLIGSMIGIFWASMLYEGLKVFREYMLQRALVYERQEISNGGVTIHRASNNHNGLRVPLATENGDSPDSSAMMNPPVKSTLLRPHPFSGMHIFQSFLHMLQVFISYLLMLIFMTYNVWLAAAVVLGAGAGYFLFGWRKKTIVDINEHCH